ncbi:hypothetical protein HAALTHF_50040n [Vreelandella aquamarina]|nr:hypothetical protein HAALTHF_50040n [Halomonas axialensis]
MRDLYQRLALTPDANNQQIKSALARCPNSALRQDATSVLAVAPHRETYDTPSPHPERHWAPARPVGPNPRCPLAGRCGQ